MTEKRFLLENSDYDLKYEFRIADLSRVEKTKEDFWDKEEKCCNYHGIGGYLEYLYNNNAFLTQHEADKVLNALAEDNEQLKSKLNNCEECLDLNRSSCARHMKENVQLKQLIEYADDIIKSHTNHDVVRQWKNIKKNIKGDV